MRRETTVLSQICFSVVPPALGRVGGRPQAYEIPIRSPLWRRLLEGESNQPRGRGRADLRVRRARRVCTWIGACRDGAALVRLRRLE